MQTRPSSQGPMQPAGEEPGDREKVTAGHQDAASPHVSSSTPSQWKHRRCSAVPGGTPSVHACCTASAQAPGGPEHQHRLAALMSAGASASAPSAASSRHRSPGPLVAPTRPQGSDALDHAKSPSFSGPPRAPASTPAQPPHHHQLTQSCLDTMCTPSTAFTAACWDCSSCMHAYRMSRAAATMPLWQATPVHSGQAAQKIPRTGLMQAFRTHAPPASPVPEVHACKASVGLVGGWPLAGVHWRCPTPSSHH